MPFQKFAVTRVLVVCALCTAVLPGLAHAQQETNSRSNSAVNNRDIIRMTKAQFDDATIVKTINAFNADLDISVAGLLELKEAGVSQTVIQAMLAKTTDANKDDPPARVISRDTEAQPDTHPARESAPLAASSAAPTTSMTHHPYSQPANPPNRETNREVNHEDPPPAPSDTRPRVFLQSASYGSNRNASRDQSMEMAKDFLKLCAVTVTINQNAANYTIRLNHIEHGLLIRDNQVEVYDVNGDALSDTTCWRRIRRCWLASAYLRLRWA